MTVRLPLIITKLGALTNFRCQQVFSGSYSETATKDLDNDVAEEDLIAEHYDYYSDSDLEDAEDLQAMCGLNNIDATTNRPQGKMRYLWVFPNPFIHFLI